MRTSGILMPIFSLCSKGGIGTLGKEAFAFVDFLHKAGQSWWQILPLNPTNYGDSPYQSFSSYAGNPYFIDPEILIEEGLLSREEFESIDFGNSNKIDYGKLYFGRIKMLKKAFSRFKPSKEYDEFCKNNAFWLDDYALFMALKNENNDTAWTEWEEPLRKREQDKLNQKQKEYSDIINLYRFIQYEFSKQWMALKSYANSKGIGIIGDIPIYVALDSSDIWSEPEQFILDENLTPKKVAGCPPDYFCESGQLWGNPLYDWKKMKSDGFDWWKRRIGYALKLYNMVRIDHFRAFEAYYAIPFGDADATGGKWIKGPGMSLFNELKKHFGDNMPIIAEDLGYLTPQVHKLLKSTGFPGMKVLQFAFDSREESDYLPHNYTNNCVVYTGTHDNDTVLGWTQTADKQDVEMARRYLHVDDNEGFNWAMMRAALMSVADICILTMQDIIGIGSEGRINTPSTVGNNWRWRIDEGCVNDWLARIVLENTKLYGRQAK